jgi:hypothetical protein
MSNVININELFQCIGKADLVQLKTFSMTDRSLWDAKMSMECMKEFKYKELGDPPTPLMFALSHYVFEIGRDDLIGIIEHLVNYTAFDVNIKNVFGDTVLTQIDQYIDSVEKHTNQYVAMSFPKDPISPETRTKIIKRGNNKMATLCHLKQLIVQKYL